MTRNKINLYNTEKYQAVFPNPDIEEISGEAVEVIISADGTEDSASNETPSSITMNASAGIWYDTGITTSYNTTFHIKSTADEETFHTFDKTIFRSAKISLTTISSDQTRVSYDELVVVHNDVTATINDTRAADAGGGNTVTYSAAVVGNQIVLKATCESGVTLKGPIEYVAV